MGVDHVDLIQLHCLVHPAEWELALSEDGALRAAVEAREEGLVRFIGVTGHGLTIAEMHRRSLERFPFDSVLFPYSHVILQDAQYAADVEQLLAICRERNVAVQTIKAIAQGPWGSTGAFRGDLVRASRRAAAHRSRGALGARRAGHLPERPRRPRASPPRARCGRALLLPPRRDGDGPAPGRAPAQLTLRLSRRSSRLRSVQILVTGAAGMLGRKLAERLARDGALGGEPVERLAARRCRGAGAADRCRSTSTRVACDLAVPGVAERARRGQARRRLPPRGGPLGRGGGRLREGLSRQPRRDAAAARGDPGDRRLLPAGRLRLDDRRLRGAVPRRDRRRLRGRAADELRDAEGDRRAAPVRLLAARLPRRRRDPAADDLRAPRRAEPGRVGVLLEHHPRAAERARGGAARRPTTFATGTPRRGPRSTSSSTPRRSTPTSSATGGA